MRDIINKNIKLTHTHSIWHQCCHGYVSDNWFNQLLERIDTVFMRPLSKWHGDAG